MPDPPSAYLSQKGGIELICEIDPGGSSFSDLDEALPISHQTLSRRLTEGKEEGLFEVESVSDDHGTTHIYRLTSKGKQLRVFMNNHGTTAEYELYNEIRKRFDESAEEVRSAVEHRPDIIFKDEDGNITGIMEIKSKTLFADDPDDNTNED